MPGKFQILLRIPCHRRDSPSLFSRFKRSLARKSLNMNLDLTSRTAVVTGASIGIGRAIAKALALEGVRVVAVARRKDLLEQLREDVRAAGGAGILPLVQDVMREDAGQKLAAAAVAELGHVDILVNNAGGSRPLAVDAPDSDWDE